MRELGGYVTLAQAGAEGEDGDAAGEVGKAAGREICGRDVTFGSGFKRPGHELGRERCDDGERGRGDGRGDQAGADAERGERGHGGRAGFAAGEAERAADDEDVAEVALVGVSGAGRVDERLRGAGPMEVPLKRRWLEAASRWERRRRAGPSGE